MKRVKVSLGSRSYSIIIGGGLLRSCGKDIRRLSIGKDAVVITNRRLLKLYGKGLAESLKRAGLSARFMIVPDSEKAKSMRVASRLIEKISRYDVGRESFIIAFGGGVIGDLGGFVASIYKRGIPYVQIPTTLLAQVDSAIGGKVAVDLTAAKNLAGAFYQPRLVISDIELLRSLGTRQIRNGLAEVIKYGVIKDAGLFKLLESTHGNLLRGDTGALEEIVFRSSKIKAGLVSKDELDRTGLRAILNYGHTIGHAIEAASAYSGRYNHGEAIAIGMVTAAGISSAMGLLGKEAACRIERLIRKAGLPAKVRGVSLPAIYRSQMHDKKFIGKTNRFVLPRRIGSADVFNNVPDRAIRSALKECSRG